MDLALLDSTVVPEWMFEPRGALVSIFPPWLLKLHYDLQLRYRERVDQLGGLSLRQLARAGNGDAQQLYAHRVYWQSLVEAAYHDIVSPHAEHAAMQAAAQVRGSGWLWITRSSRGESGYTVVAVQTAGAPPFNEQLALAIDLWEHAWYPHWGIDRTAYLRQMLRHLRWDLLSDPRYA